VRNQDLFGVPVQLTYKGQKSFNTVCGGLFSLLLLVGFTVAFVLQFRSLYTNPIWDATPSTYDYSSENIILTPKEATLAI